jgi:putative autoinducer-2 (AI-2) aldolase
MVAVGSKFEALTIRNLTAIIGSGSRCGIPILGVTAVGKELTRDARYLSLACRVCAENGAHVVKTYFCESQFETVAASCPVPIVIAGGKKLPERDALRMAWQAIDQGAAGVDMGRNVFQAECPTAMIQAVRAVVHDGEKPQQAFDRYQALKNAVT